MEHLSGYVYVVFGATVLLAIWLFSKATSYSKSFLIIMASWVLLQSGLGVAGFYSHAATFTNRFPIMVLPPMLLLISQFATARGRAFIDGLDLKVLTLIHIIRIPVELVLFWLFVHKAIPQAMSFEGRNFDVLSGLSAPIIYYFGFVKQKIGRAGLIAWNVLCIVLLLNVVGNAILSLPGRYVQFGFEQPNIALGYFPFNLLPALLVPMVLFSNLAAIRILSKKGKFQN